MTLIGICGGIGSGKSVVSRILRQRGYLVYDCDLRARILMDGEDKIKIAIRDRISSEVTDGISLPDRRKLAEIVFSDESLRLELNSIVHGAVSDDLRNWVLHHAGRYRVLFVESAIVAESGLASMCDSIWKVECPEHERVARVMQRDGCSESQAYARIESQRKEELLLARYADKIQVINNARDSRLLQRIDCLLDTPFIHQS